MKTHHIGNVLGVLSLFLVVPFWVCYLTPQITVIPYPYGLGGVIIAALAASFAGFWAAILGRRIWLVSALIGAATFLFVIKGLH